MPLLDSSPRGIQRAGRAALPMVVVIAVLVALQGLGLGPAGAAESGKGSWTLVQHMIEQRNPSTAVLLSDGSVLTMGGMTSSGVTLSSAERYSPASDTWSAAGNMGVARFDPTATLLLDGRVLVVGPGPSAELYSPLTNSWSPAASMAFGRSEHTATLLADGRVLVVGGDMNAVQGDMGAEIYDPSTNSWSPTASMAFGRSDHTATLLSDGTVLVTGGHTDAAPGLASTEIYDPSADQWSSMADMSVGRLAHTATLLADGRVLVAGGRSGTTTSVGHLAEIYDPVADEWLTVPSMKAVHDGHTATLLADGTVMVAGTFNPAEFYDPVTNSWGSAFSMNVIRTGHSAVRLDDGRVLVAGGCREMTHQEQCETFTAEIYDPSGASFVIGSDVSVAEGDSSTVPAEFTVSLSRPLSHSVSVRYGAPPGTASWRDDDYVRASGTLTFAPGETSKTVAVVVIGDSLFERDERFFLRLSNPIDAGIGDGEAIGTIVNDDPRGSNTTSTSTSLPSTTTTSSSSTTSTSLPSTTTTSSTSTTSTSLPTATTLPPEGPIEIDGGAVSNGDVARLTGSVTCDEGNRYRVEVVLTQGGTEAEGVATGTCTGTPQSFGATVMVTFGPGYSDGMARAEVTADIGDPGTRTVVDSFSAARLVEIDVPGGMMAAMLNAIPPR